MTEDEKEEEFVARVSVWKQSVVCTERELAAATDALQAGGSGLVLDCDIAAATGRRVRVGVRL